MTSKRISTLILKIVLILVGLGVFIFFAFIIPDEVGIQDIGAYTPFVLLMYLSTFPFYFVLYKTFKLLNLIDKNKTFTEETIKALKYIKYGSIFFSVMYIIAIPYIFTLAERDDAPGVGAIGLIFVFGSVAAATVAAVLQKVVRNGIDLKKENELTV